MIEELFTSEIKERTAQENERFLTLLSFYLNCEENAVTLDALKEMTSDGDLSEEEAFCYLLAAHLGVDAGKTDRRFFNDYFLSSVKKLNVNDYYEDLYFKLVKFDGKVKGRSTLKTMTCPACTPFVRDDFLFEANGRVIPQIGFFTEDYSYPAVLTDDREWMTLLPNEINSQKKYIAAAHGKVLTYGLGLGYYVLNVAIKDEVSSVTVVDMDENVIKLFKENILPFFPKKAQEKIKVVCADAYKYAEGLKAGDYDYIYADIWHDCGDGKDMYLKFKDLEKYCETAEYGYWIEDSIKYYL